MGLRERLGRGHLNWGNLARVGGHQEADKLGGAGHSGEKVAQVLWDITGFYENLQPRALCQDLRDLGFPRELGVLAMASHKGPRIMNLEGCVGPTIPGVGKSVITGCTSSTSMARTTTHGPLKAVQEQFRGKGDPCPPCG